MPLHPPNGGPPKMELERQPNSEIHHHNPGPGGLWFQMLALAPHSYRGEERRLRKGGKHGCL